MLPGLGGEVDRGTRMEQSSIRDLLPYVGICAGLAGLVVFAIKRRKRQTWPKDVVILHQFDRGPRAPSISPYCLKLETYLRMSGIPYVNDFSGTMSSKGKSPWITYNDVHVADSHFCIRYLKKKFDVDLDKHLTNTERSIGRCFVTLVENNLVHAVAMFRWVYYPRFITTYFQKTIGLVAYLAVGIIRRRVRKALWYEGTARHNEREVLELAEEDLKAISDYLGSKSYLNGPEPSEADCSVFGVLAQCVWHLSDAPLEKMVNDQFPNLRAYCERIKDKYWPDWDQCITHDYTVAATK